MQIQTATGGSHVLILFIGLSMVGGALGANPANNPKGTWLEALASTVSEWRGLASILCFGLAILVLAPSLSTMSIVVSATSGLVAACATSLASYFSCRTSQ